MNVISPKSPDTKIGFSCIKTDTIEWYKLVLPAVQLQNMKRQDSATCSSYRTLTASFYWKEFLGF